MAYQIPVEVQEKIARFEQLKAQLQMVVAQRAEMAARKRELESALSALKEVKKEDVYRRVGELMIKVKDTKGLVTEMTEELDTLNVRTTSIEGQEKTLREMYERLGKELNEALKGYK